jgi:hypothetical protein
MKNNTPLHYMLQITQKNVDPNLFMLYELLQINLDKSMALPNNIYTVHSESRQAFTKGVGSSVHERL